VQARLTQNRQFAMRNSKAAAYLLRALASCGVCQLACTAIEGGVPQLTPLQANKQLWMWDRQRPTVRLHDLRSCVVITALVLLELF
jgi:hypothetical protein